MQQLKYDLARAEGLQNMQRYEQLLGVSSALGANSGLGPNGTLGGNHALAAHGLGGNGLGGNGTLGAANNTALGNAALMSQLHPELAKTPHLLQSMCWTTFLELFRQPIPTKYSQYPVTCVPSVLSHAELKVIYNYN